VAKFEQKIYKLTLQFLGCDAAYSWYSCTGIWSNMLPPNHGYLCTKVLNIITNDYNLIRQWHFKSRPTIVRLNVLKVVLPKV